MPQRNWIIPYNCPICSKKLNPIFPKEGEWEWRYLCDNKCYDVVHEDGKTTVFVKAEGAKPKSYEWSHRTSGREYDAVQKKILHACKKAKDVWDNLNTEASNDIQKAV